jgi:TPR repeat protein
MLAPPHVAAPEAPPRASPATVAALLRRGHAVLGLGDISAARRFFERAAAAGSGEAALAAGGTYDPTVLATLAIAGIRPDPDAAAVWYSIAASLGAPEAEARLAVLKAATAPRTGEPGTTP